MCDEVPQHSFIYDGSSKKIIWSAGPEGVSCLVYDADAPVYGIVPQNLYIGSCDEQTNSQWYYDEKSKALKTFAANDYCMSVASDGQVFMAECGVDDANTQSILIPDSWMPEISITGLYQQVRVNYDV